MTSRYPSLKNYDQERVINRIRGFQDTGIDSDTARIMAESEERARVAAERQEKLNKEPQYATAKDLRFPVLRPEQLAKDTGMDISEAEKLLSTMPIPDKRRVLTAQKLMEDGKEVEALRAYAKIAGVRVDVKKATPKTDNSIKLSRYDNTALAQEFEDADEGETTYTMGRGRFEAEYPEPEFDALNFQEFEDADEGETTYTMGRGRFAPKFGPSPGLIASIQKTPQIDERARVGNFLANLPIATLAGAGVVRDIKIIKESREKEEGAKLTLKQLDDTAKAAGFGTSVYKKQRLIRGTLDKTIENNQRNQIEAEKRVQERIKNLDLDNLRNESNTYAREVRERLEKELANVDTMREVRGFRSGPQIANLRDNLTRDIENLKRYETATDQGALPPFPKIANYGIKDQRLINRVWGYTPDEWQKEIAIQMAVAGLTYGAGKLPIFRGGTSGGGGRGPTKTPPQTPREFIESLTSIDEIGRVRTNAGLKAGRSYLNPTDEQVGRTTTAVLERVKIKPTATPKQIIDDAIAVATPEEAAIIAGATNKQIGNIIAAAGAGTITGGSRAVITTPLPEVTETETEPEIETFPDIGIQTETETEPEKDIDSEEVTPVITPLIPPGVTDPETETETETEVEPILPSPGETEEPSIEPTREEPQPEIVSPNIPAVLPDIGIADDTQEIEEPANIEPATQTETIVGIQPIEETSTEPETEVDPFLPTPTRISTGTGKGSGRSVIKKKGKGPKKKAVIMGKVITPDIVGWKQGSVYRYKDLRTGQEAVSKKPLPKYQIKSGRTPRASITVVKQGKGIPTEFTDNMGVVRATIGPRGRTIKFNRRLRK